MNSKSEWGGFKLNRLSIEQSDYEKMKEVVDIEAANKAESETIKSLKLRVSNCDIKLKSSYRKRKAAVSSEPGPEEQSATTKAMPAKNNNSFTSLGAKPKKPRNTQGQSSVIPGTIVNARDCSRKGKTTRKVPMVVTTPSVLAWLESARKETDEIVTSTPTKNETKSDASQVLNSTENNGAEPLPECDASAIGAMSFGSNASSEDCFFNEACDVTDAKKELGSSENSTDGMLKSVCEASVDEISKFYEKNKVSALGNVVLGNLAPNLSSSVHLSSEAVKNEHYASSTVDDHGNLDMGLVATISPPRPPVATPKVVSLSDDTFLREAHASSALIWSRLVSKAEQNVLKLEGKRQLGSFKEAFEHAQALELSRRPYDNCLNSLEAMTVAGRKPVLVPDVARSDGDLGALVSGRPPVADVLPCVPVKLEAEKPMMDEFGQGSVPLPMILHPEASSSLATPADAPHSSSVIGCDDLD